MGKSELRGRRALSAQSRRWQSPGLLLSGPLYGRAALLAGLLAGSAPAFAVPGGDIGTLATGVYVCEVPRPEVVSRGSVVDDAGFTIVTASSYRSHGTFGSYLLTGIDAVFTSGPRKGERYRRISSGSLRKLNADNSETPMRCVLANRNNR